MIKITTKGLTACQITGHAGYAPKGADIVCAAVSALYGGLVTSLNAHSDCLMSVVEAEDGYNLTIDSPDSASTLLMKAFITSVSAIADNYPKNIKVTTS